MHRHGATPNVSNQIRVLPGIEYLAGWYAADAGIPRTMPHAVWATLSPEAQHACRFVKAEEGAVVPGAGVLHPLASARFNAFVEMGGAEGIDAETLERARKAYFRSPTGSLWGELGGFSTNVKPSKPRL